MNELNISLPLKELLFDKIEYLMESHVLVTQDSSMWATTIILVLMVSAPQSNTKILFSVI